MHCGSAMTAVRGRHADYLICGGKKRGICTGAGAVWRVKTAEELVGRLLRDQLRNLVMPAADDPPEESPELQALILRRGELLRQMTDPDGGDITLLTEAAAQLTAQIASLRTNTAAVSAEALHLPDWDACSPEQRKTAAHILLHCIMAEAHTLHVFLN